MLPPDPVPKTPGTVARGDTPSEPGPSLYGLETPAGISVEQPAPLRAGMVLAGRFEIVRWIASGGMGDVYEAHDRELRERVALKTIRPEIARNERHIERFLREIQLARKITHANVCRLFEFARHRGDEPGGPSTAIAFLAMQLLEGPTLAARIAERGPLSPADALPIVEQIAAGLDAAHSEGIIHRDIKSSNVILVPATGGRGERAVITDFGLAQTSDADARLTGSLDWVGSPPYVAPEQISGGRVSPATDVYALGVVMFEMLTREWPFTGDTAREIAMKRLREEPRKPSTVVPQIDATWEATILRCLERDPAQRLQTAGAVVEALHTGTMPRRTRTWSRPPTAWIATGVAAVVLACAAGIGTYEIATHRREVAGPATPSGAVNAKTRRAIAVFGFKNLKPSSSNDYLSQGLPTWLSTSLGADEQLRTVSGEDVAQLERDLNVAGQRSLGAQTLARIHARTGAEMVLVGAYVVTGEGNAAMVRIDMNLQNTATGQTSPLSTEIKLADIASAGAEQLGTQVRAKLGLGELNGNESAIVAASLPADPDARRAYAEGIQKLHVMDAMHAREALQKAVDIEPQYPLSHAALASAWAALGYDSKAQAEAKTAFDLRMKLSREEQLSIDAAYRVTSHDWDQASKTYRTLLEFFPDNLDYGLKLADAQTHGGRGHDAITTIAELRKSAALPAVSREDPRLDLAEANASNSFSDYKAVLAAAERASANAAKLGATLVQAHALWLQCWAAGNLRDPQGANRACEQAREAFKVAGDRLGMARSATGLANLAVGRGDFSAAQKLYVEALETAQSIGAKRDIAGAFINYGDFQASRGDVSGSRKSYEQAWRIAGEIGDRQQQMKAENDLGTVLYTEGNFEAARQAFERARQAAEALGDDVGMAHALNNIGSVLFLQGKLAEARHDIEAALIAEKKAGAELDRADSLLALGDVLLASGDVSGAIARYNESLASRDARDKPGRASSQTSLAGALVEAGRAPEAESIARSAAEEFAAEGLADQQAMARDVLVRALLAQNKVGEAGAEVERMAAVAVQDRGIKTSWLITLARVRAREGKTADSAQALARATQSAAQAHLVPQQFDARLASGEIALARRAPAARSQLASLARDASRAGFGSVAQKAMALTK